MPSCSTFWLLFVVSYVTIALTDPINIDVFCNSSGMDVRVRFGTPFKGLIYSEGYLNKTSCRYFTAERMVSNFSFHIPLSTCGTEIQAFGSTFHQVNNIVFQNDPVLQTHMDIVHKLSCGSSSLKSKPFTLGLTAVSSGSLYNTNFKRPSKIWMEIKKGTDPSHWKEEIGDVKVGDEMVVVVYISNSKHAKIINCEALEKNVKNSTSVTLLDASGCPLQPYIFTSFEFFPGSDDIQVAFSRMRAFRFSKSNEMLISCGVEICENKCLTECSSANQISDNHSVQKNEFVKRSLTIQDTPALHILQDGPIQQKVAWNATALQVMREKADELSSGLKAEKRHRRLNLQSARNSNFKRRHTTLDFMTEETALSRYESSTPVVATDFTSDQSWSASTSFIQDTDPNSVQLIYQAFHNTGLPKSHEIQLNASTEFVEHNYFDVKESERQNVTQTATKGLSVLPSNVVLDIDNSYLNESRSHCFSPVKFAVVTSCLIFLVLCLFVTCVLLTLNIKRIKRNNSISRFLLYSYH